MTLGTSTTAPRPDAPPLDDGLASVVAANVRSFRLRQGLSLDLLASLAGSDRATLEALEAGGGQPTIEALWKIAKALDVPFSSLLSSVGSGGTTVIRRAESSPLASDGGGFTSRALFPLEGERQVEFYELRLAPGAHEEADAHAAGTTENLLVSSGAVEVVTGDGAYRLWQGDAIQFDADASHAYRNVGEEEAVLYLVMTYIL
ncbi:cupin domain-containing protein [Azospirillum sp. TSO22-1]|uniref:cupin domain-containing protein n=1 Tax=Azospirillum sp. TSO22-1 TaxID=716789 RepID=UPI000D605F9F|nr:cupin domain-containing protein [Azospirillum sp. TSO22-1]PWC38627.1 transcriptional regulator [Azospirillum sp. TSO22-1]